MPELLGWWLYVVAVPLGGGALLTLFSLGGRGKKGARSGESAPRNARPAAAKAGKSAKAAPTKTSTRQTRAAELPPLFLLQNFLLIWSLVALCAVPFQPQNAAIPLLTVILGVIALLTLGLLAVCAQLFVRLTPVDASSITQKSDLQGRVGECDATIDTRRGSILVRDEFGTLHHLAARCEQSIARGEAVLLVEYNANGDFFQVCSWMD
ncbi:DUF1449 family protein [bacterium]|nr:MAG: DUF1449 family protein [bacterium]